jgi:hypothetical protein
MQCNYGENIINCLIQDVRGPGIDIPTGRYKCGIYNTIIANVKGGAAIQVSGTPNVPTIEIFGNTIYNPSGDGILVTSNYTVNVRIVNNTISKIATGKYGVNYNSGAAADNARLTHTFQNNNIYVDGAGGSRLNGIEDGAGNLNVDPGFTAPGSYDFTIGSALKALGYPTAIPVV